MYFFFAEFKDDNDFVYKTNSLNSWSMQGDTLELDKAYVKPESNGMFVSMSLDAIVCDIQQLLT